MNDLDLSSMRRATIPEVHNMMLEIIKHIDKICRLENIKYFATYGTLLGAVREKGFIAWDDDADLFMLREDYEKFCKVFNKYPDSKFFLQNVYTDKYFFLPLLARVRMNDTYCGGEKIIPKYHNGLYVDIFMLDYAFKDLKQNTRKQNFCRYLHRSMYKHISSLKGCHNIERFLHMGLYKILPMKFWNALYFRTIKNNDPDKTMLIDFCGCYGNEQERFLADCFKDVIYLDFEDMKIPCPAGYDKILRTVYGDDYMTPIDRRFKRVLVKK